jgi:iron-sulfur cluster assembly accessory protein
MNEFSLTEQAKTQVNTLCKDSSVYAVCLSVKGGGCAGFEYAWSSISNPEDVVQESHIIDSGAGYFVIDADSKAFFEGTQVDYTTSLVGSKFEINNPNAQAACGCGVSVNFDTDILSSK